MESGKLWATEISHLNDYTEFRHGLDVARGVTLERLRDDSGRDKLVLERVASEFAAMVPPQLFVSSFSSRKDSRTQWGLYCRGSGGIALGFDHAALETVVNAANARSPRSEPPPKGPEREWRIHAFQLRMCLYRERTQRKLLGHHLEELLTTLASMRTGRPGLAIAGEDIAFLLSTIAAAFKDPSFEAEEEWRVIGQETDTPSIRSFIRNGSPVFYSEMDLVADTGKFPVVELLVGPQPDLQAAVQGWSRWLAQRGLGKVAVVPSRVPLRGI
jgi:hypothetical protein